MYKLKIRVDFDNNTEFDNFIFRKSRTTLNSLSKGLRDLTYSKENWVNRTKSKTIINIIVHTNYNNRLIFHVQVTVGC